MANMTQAEMQAKIKELEDANKTLTDAQNKALGLKVGNKANVVLSGLQQFPVTLNYDQWERLFAFVPEIQKFIDSHKSQLLTRAEALKRFG